MNDALVKIQAFADEAHDGQQRKYANEKFIMHPVRVMENCRKVTTSLPILAAALLHDVLEDTAVSREQMHQFLTTVMNEKDAARTTDIVIELTDVYTKENYPTWNRRKRKAKEAERIARTSADAQTVKYADIIDNCRDIVMGDPDFAPVFLRECRMLLRSMTKGNKELHDQAVAAVNQRLGPASIT